MTSRPAPPPEGERVASTLNREVPVAAPGEFEPLRLGAGRVSERGQLSVWPPVILAPMAGVTNLAFRSLCREYGAGLFVSEMITARGYLMGNRLTALLASSSPDKKPRSVQVYGADPVDLGEMVRSLVDEGVDHLFYLQGEQLLGGDGEAATDGSHPSDMGMVRYADAYEPALRALLRQY